MSKPKPPKYDGRSILLALVLAVNLVIVFGFAAEANKAYRKAEEMLEQMEYLSDTNSVLLSEVNNLRDEVLESMAQSQSLLESWDIALRSMDFEKDTYTVDIQVVPKEYTDNMEISIYFGTKAASLEREDFRYCGSMELSLNEAYDNNVALLLSEGNSRKTEVLRDYTDVRTDLTNILYGSLSDAPGYAEGNLLLEGTGYVKLDAGEFFRFTELSLIVEKDEELLAVYDLAAMSQGEGAKETEAEKGIDGEAAEAEIIEAERTGAEVMETEAIEVESEDSLLTWMAYSFMLGEKIPVSDPGHVRVYLQAVSDNDYIFDYELACFELEETGTAADEAAKEMPEGQKAEAEDPETDEPEEESVEEESPEESPEEAAAVLQIKEDSMLLGRSAVIYDPQGHEYILK